MMKILIVDDEAQILDGLRHTIDWTSAGIDEIYSARNGTEGLKIVEMHMPEIIISDIRMPGMDGLEMSSQVKTLYPDTKIILLSGYMDFNYAKQAISIGVEEYYVKPVNIDELSNKVKTIIKGIQHGRLLHKSENLNLRLLRNNFFSEIIQGVELSPYDLNKCLSDLKINFGGYGIVCVLVELDNYVRLFEQIGYKKILELKELIERRILSIFNENYPLVAFTPLEAKQAGIFLHVKTKESPSLLKVLLTGLVFQLENLLTPYKITATLGISQIISGLDFKASFEDARTALSYKFFAGNNTALFSHDLKKESPASPVSPFDIEKQIIEAAKSRNMNILLKELQPLFHSYKASSPVAIETIKKYMGDLANILQLELKTIHGNPGKLENIFPSNIEILEDYIKYLEIFLYELTENAEPSAVKNKWLIDQAKKYILDNISRDITVQDVADYVERNPNYFSHIFKKESGLSFTDYLNNARVEAAKELLKKTFLMSYEISDKVGFYNYRYFTQIFRKIVGKTPTQYRNE